MPSLPCTRFGIGLKNYRHIVFLSFMLFGIDNKDSATLTYCRFACKVLKAFINVTDQVFELVLSYLNLITVVLIKKHIAYVYTQW